MCILPPLLLLLGGLYLGQGCAVTGAFAGVQTNPTTSPVGILPALLLRAHFYSDLCLQGPSRAPSFSHQFVSAVLNRHLAETGGITRTLRLTPKELPEFVRRAYNVRLYPCLFQQHPLLNPCSQLHPRSWRWFDQPQPQLHHGLGC